MQPIFRDHRAKDKIQKLSLAWGRAIQLLQTLVFPPRCLSCGICIEPVDPRATPFTGLGQVFCPSCSQSGITFFKPPHCPLCGHGFDQGQSHVCESCLKKRPVTGRVRAAFQYQGLVAQAIPLFKYQAKLSLARPFEQALFDAFFTHFSDPGPDLILPIPLHPRRLFGRGFNQAHVLVRNFSNRYKARVGGPPPWQIDITSLHRVAHTRPQTGYDVRSRKKNLKNAFQVRPGARKIIRGKYILLVDDVYTTGATCNEAARALLRVGASRVDVLVLARA